MYVAKHIPEWTLKALQQLRFQARRTQPGSDLHNVYSEAGYDKEIQEINHHITQARDKLEKLSTQLSDKL